MVSHGERLTSTAGRRTCWGLDTMVCQLQQPGHTMVRVGDIAVDTQLMTVVMRVRRFARVLSLIALTGVAVGWQWGAAV